jgi:hypothetical protein
MAVAAPRIVEHLDGVEHFGTGFEYMLHEAKVPSEDRKTPYNQCRTHSAPGCRPPALAAIDAEPWLMSA